LRRFADEDIPVYTLSNFDILSEVAAEEGYISSEDINKIKAFAVDPQGWGE